MLLTNAADIEQVENYIISYVQKNGYMPTRREIYGNLKINKTKLSTVISLSKDLHLVLNKNRMVPIFQVSSRVLEEIVSYFENNREKGVYFESFIDALKEYISYEQTD